MAKKTCDLLNKKVGKQNLELMIKSKNESLIELVKGKLDNYIDWKMTGYTIVEFKRELLNISISKNDIDNLADFLDKNEDGFITQ